MVGISTFVWLDCTLLPFRVSIWSHRVALAFAFLRVRFSKIPACLCASPPRSLRSVLAVVSAEITKPFGDRGSEGMLQFATSFSGMAELGVDNSSRCGEFAAAANRANRFYSDNRIRIGFRRLCSAIRCFHKELLVNLELTRIVEFEYVHVYRRLSRWADRAVEIGRIVEKSIRESKAVDTESLCIVPGEKVRETDLFLEAIYSASASRLYGLSVKFHRYLSRGTIQHRPSPLHISPA
jgi:hypothetical protein